MVRLECKICLREYKINIPELTPRILTSCGHTVCGECAETLKSQNASGHVTCPFDRKVTIIDGDVQELHKNFAILEYMEETGQGVSPPVEQIHEAAPIDNAENHNNRRAPRLNRENGLQNDENPADQVLPAAYRLEDHFPVDDLIGWFEEVPPFLLNDDFVEEDDESVYWESDDDEQQLFADMINNMDNFNIGDFEENYENFNDEYV